MMRSIELSYLMLGLLVAISAALLTWNLDDGLPFSPHPDETHTVPYTVPEGFNHVFDGFRYPGLAKRIYSIPRLLADWPVDSPAIVLAARYISVALSLISLVLFFWLLKRLAPSTGDWIALAGVVALACHPLFVITARVAWAESLLLCCLLGYFIALWRFHHQPSTLRLIVAAGLLGLSVGAKYSGLFLYLPLMTSIVLKHHQEATRIVRDAALATSTFILSFLATTPQLAARPEAFIADFLWNTQHYSEGHPGMATQNIAWSYVDSLGPILAVLGCLALPLWLRRDRTSFLLLVPWALLYFVKLSGYRMAMGRNMLIVLPILWIALAQAARGMRRLHPRLQVAAALSVLALGVVPQLLHSSSVIPWRERLTTLDIAHPQVNALIPEHASVWRSTYTPPVEASQVQVGFFLDSKVLDALEQGTLDYVVVSESFSDGLKPGAYRYREYSALIQRLETVGELDLRIPASQDVKGSGVLVYSSSAR